MAKYRIIETPNKSFYSQKLKKFLFWEYWSNERDWTGLTNYRATIEEVENFIKREQKRPYGKLKVVKEINLD